MSTARMASAGGRMGRIPSGTGDAKGGAGGWKWAVAAAAVAIVLLASWWLGFFGRSIDPRVVEILAMQEQAVRQFTASGGPATLAEAEASVEATVAIMEKVRELPRDVREQAESSGRSLYMSTMRANMDRYFATPPEKRRAELDRQIKQSDLMRQAWESSKAAQAMTAGGGGGGGSGGSERRDGGGPPRSRTEEDRNRWRKDLIDRTTPEQRARYVEYRRAMEKRREELGLPAPSRGPR